MPIDARQALIDYLKMKVDQSDWHAVSDAANDLRVLEAQRLQVPTTSISVPHNGAGYGKDLSPGDGGKATA